MSVMAASAERRGEAVAGSRMRSNVALTAAALNGVPSWKRTPWRSLKVQVSLSSDVLHEVASAGCMLPASSGFTSVSWMCITMREVGTSVTNCGSSVCTSVPVA